MQGSESAVSADGEDSASISGPSQQSGSVELAISADRQASNRRGAGIARREGLVVDEGAVGLEPEHRAIPPDAAGLSCSVQTAVAGLRQPAVGMLAAIPTSESVYPGERPVSADAEDR